MRDVPLETMGHLDRIKNIKRRHIIVIKVQCVDVITHILNQFSSGASGPCDFQLNDFLVGHEEHHLVCRQGAHLHT